MKRLLWILTLLIVLLMSTQWGVSIGAKKTEIRRGEQVLEKREGGIHVTPGDALLALTFLLWAGHSFYRAKVFEARLPLLAVFVLLAVVLVSALISPERGRGMKELVQLAAYFVGGWMVFANCIGTRSRLRAAVGLFSLVVAAIVVVALYQYHREVGNGNLFRVAGTFGNRNVLGAFFAAALPFVFSLGLHEERAWQRFALILVVAIGALVMLSGGALIAVAVAVVFVAALKSQKALVGVLIAIALGLLVIPDMMPVRERDEGGAKESAVPRHADVVVNSIAPFAGRANYLEWRDGVPVPPASPSDAAMRYKHWAAAVEVSRIRLSRSVFGSGPGRYNDEVGPMLAQLFPDLKPANTDSVPDFNINTPEPDSLGTYFVVCVESGPLALLALAWVLVLLFAGNVTNWRGARDEFGQALALGSASAVIGAAIAAVFSDILVRGVAMPFIFAALSGILWAKLPGADVDSRPVDAA